MAAPKGNQNARKAKDWEMSLRQALHAYEHPDKNIKRGESLAAIAKKVVEAALEGSMFAIEHIANRLDGKPTEHVIGEFTHHLAEELTDGELADIAAGSRTGASETPQGPQEPPAVH